MFTKGSILKSQCCNVNPLFFSSTWSSMQFLWTGFYLALCMIKCSSSDCDKNKIRYYCFRNFKKYYLFHKICILCCQIKNTMKVAISSTKFTINKNHRNTYCWKVHDNLKTSFCKLINWKVKCGIYWIIFVHYKRNALSN